VPHADSARATAEAPHAEPRPKSVSSTARESAAHAIRRCKPAAGGAAAADGAAAAGIQLSGVASNRKTARRADCDPHRQRRDGVCKGGDKLSNGYQVVRVDEMSVTLVDAIGVTQTIRLP
jgi:hypothetical protein